MNTSGRDPKGYYAILGLDPGANAAEIRSAYRRRARLVHPDHDSSPTATEDFVRLSDAYTALKDPASRAHYDGAAAPPPPRPAIVAPVVCDNCGAISAQPRYLALPTARSYLLWGRLHWRRGVFCRDCADQAAARAAIGSWAWGWWSPPGLVLTPFALLVALIGGHKPHRDNARILLHQARAFLAAGNLPLARALAYQAEPFARHRDDRAAVAAVLRSTHGITGGYRLKNRWKPGGRVFWAQAMPLLALPLTIAIFIMIALQPWDGPASTTAAIMAPPANIGEIRHVATDGLKLRQSPLAGAPVLTLLDRFTAVEITALGVDPDWVGVRASSGIEGFVPARELYAGSAARFKEEWCTANPGAPPSAGEVLTRRIGGDHRLLIHNDGRRDSVVKLKTLAGSTVLAVYVPATFHIGVGGIPDGTYRIEFASGARYSRDCGLFIDQMRAMVLPVTVTFHYQSPSTPRSLTRIAEIWLAPTGEDDNRPMPVQIPDERFAADE